MKFQGCFLVFLTLQQLLTGVQGIPRYCNHTLRAKDSARSQYEVTKTSLIAPRCPLNGLTWRQPRFRHIVVFFKRYLSFKLCVTSHSPGTAIYRLKGTSKQLVATANASGNLGCFESECRHLTFQMEPDKEGKRIQFTYTYNQIKKNPRCTAVCQQACLCSSQFVFIGNLVHTVHEESTGLYRIYFNIVEFIKYNSVYSGKSLLLYQHINNNNNNNNNNNCIGNSSMLDFTQSSSASAAISVPTTGLVKVYSKNPLFGEGKHLLAASLSYLRGDNILTLCCVEEDESYAVNVLRDLMFRRQCACSAAN